MSLSAFCGQDLPVFGELVGWWYLRLLEHDSLASHSQPVLVAIQICLGTNLGQTVVDETLATAIGKECVEGRDVRIDSLLQGRVGRVVGRRVSEEILTAAEIKLVVPVGVCSLGRHLGRGSASDRGPGCFKFCPKISSGCPVVDR